jgi:hypothetical protein
MRIDRSVQALLLGAVLCFMNLGCSQGDNAKIIPPPRITVAEGQKPQVASAGGGGGPAKKAPEKEKAPDEKADSSTKPGDKTTGEDGKKTPDKP